MTKHDRRKTVPLFLILRNKRRESRGFRGVLVRTAGSSYACIRSIDAIRSVQRGSV